VHVNTIIVNLIIVKNVIVKAYFDIRACVLLLFHAGFSKGPHPHHRR